MVQFKIFYSCLLQQNLQLVCVKLYLLVICVYLHFISKHLVMCSLCVMFKVPSVHVNEPMNAAENTID